MTGLVLSLFPGIGLLDRGFEDEGFCVVRGPDLLWGGDVKRFHPPAGRFDGVIGGPPCQARSRLRHLVRHNAETKGYKQAVDLMPEFVRVVEEAQPAWWLCENVPTDLDEFPAPDPAGYQAQFMILCNRACPEEPGSLTGAVQRRERWFWFGTRDGRQLMPRLALWENPERSVTVTCDVRDRPVKLGGSGKQKLKGKGRMHPTAPQIFEVPSANANGTIWDPDRQGVRGLKTKAMFKAMCKLQGLPEEFDLPPFKVAEKIRAVGNGVPYPLARTLAIAVREAMEAGNELADVRTDGPVR